MSKEKVEVKRIVIEMGGKEVELSIEDARKLMAALQGIFNEPKEKEYVPYPQPYYVPQYIRPWAHPKPYWWGTYTASDIPLYKSTSGTVTDNTLYDGHTVKCSLSATDAITIR